MVVFEHPARERGAAMRTTLGDEPVGAVLIPVEREALAEHAHRDDRVLGELGNGGDRLPKAAHVLAHGRSRPDERQALLTLFARRKMIDGHGTPAL